MLLPLLMFQLGLGSLRACNKGLHPLEEQQRRTQQGSPLFCFLKRGGGFSAVGRSSVISDGPHRFQILRPNMTVSQQRIRNPFRSTQNLMLSSYLLHRNLIYGKYFCEEFVFHLNISFCRLYEWKYSGQPF